MEAPRRLHRAGQHGRADGRQPGEGRAPGLRPSTCRRLPRMRQTALGVGISASAKCCGGGRGRPRSSSPCCRRASMCCRSGRTSPPRLKPGTLLIDSSTIDVESARKAHALAPSAAASRSTRRSRAALAAPTAGTLTFMVGGSERSLCAGASRSCQPMGKRHRALRRRRQRDRRPRSATT
jgi:hypothetical protein